ncbi:hypothetical protein TREMEDRAFT_61549 [Tremella mesenterica DSM 1558]|uniref:uncharacterized protein n=1 Tax=Tremella mesenterica (strain ATCC 24925 / CBS 8224 / DSM 1558 / NBRC 9311 / NRRL Y-6157 / RJB 2259-6 / UBC 559-6) TaxID=578456 RepID=UPI0003F4A2E4|nr:uncharacterized protein TREMEDRAFT_61549 [Tremella mesenterica DSM 1558]EIW69782.1 hypothetical protein TREMEDRAFT_61549 [Tremella mesenterica DSM 1558]
MSTRQQLDAYQAFMDRFAATLSQQRDTPRQVSSMGFGALAITDGSPSVGAPVTGAPAAVPSVPVSPATAPTPLSSGQQEVRPAPVGPSQPSGQSATVVEIDDDDEEMDVVSSDEETGDVVGDERTGGAGGDDEEMGDVDEETYDVDLGDEELFEDRDGWLSELNALSPVREVDGSPEVRVRVLSSNGKKRLAYMAKLDEVKVKKRRRLSSAQGNVRPSSAKRTEVTRSRSPSVLGEKSPSPTKEPGSARKVSLREQDRLWKLFVDERERWEVASPDESCDRCRREIITYGRKKWPCLRPVKPHNRGSRCASCTSGPCSFCPPNIARDIPPRSSAPFTPSAAVRHRLPTAQDKEFPSPPPSANFSSPGPTSPSPAVRRPPNSPVAGPSRLPATPSAGSSRRAPRRAPSASLQPSTPVAGPSRLPATPSAGPSRPTRSRPTPVSTQEDSSLSLPPALGTRSRQPSVPPATGLSTPAPPANTSPSKAPKGKGKKKKAVQFEPAVVENEGTQLPEEIPIPLDHPYVTDDPRIPEEEKQLATFRSLIIGLTTQLHANRRDTAKLLEYCMKLVSGMNTLSRTMATLVSSSDIGPLARTELARVSRELITEMSDFYRNLFDSPFLLNPIEYLLPPTLDWLRPPNPARLSSQDAAFLDILALPPDCLRILRQLWKLPSLNIARDSALHDSHILAFNMAWRETRALRRVVPPKDTENSSGGGPPPGNGEQGGSSQQALVA